MRAIDEINDLSQDEILDISSYFDEMEISGEEKEKRKEFAESMMDIMLFIFALFSIMKQYDSMNKQFIISRLQSRYSEEVMKYMDIDKAVDDYIQRFSEEIVDTTLKHLDEEYYLSNDRATIISVNETNSILGYRQLQEAKEKGYTKKTWITEGDKKVRKTHREVDMKEIPIDEYFLVGDSLMMYSHDNITFDIDPKEVINCRCSVVYS